MSTERRFLFLREIRGYHKVTSKISLFVKCYQCENILPRVKFALCFLSICGAHLASEKQRYRKTTRKSSTSGSVKTSESEKKTPQLTNNKTHKTKIRRSKHLNQVVCISKNISHCLCQANQ